MRYQLNMGWFVIAFAAAASVCGIGSANAQSREEKVRADKQRVQADGFWLYNDYAGARAKAQETGKPILVVLRCIPCEECVKLDDELVDSDPVIKPLMEQFVCVRIVGTNGLDLNTFQYDTDQSFAVFMLNADETIYGRFGTRSHRTEWIGDVSLTGMAKALERALALHKEYPANRSQLAGKRGQPLEFASPEKYPSLREKFTDTLNYEGNVVQSCIHCHQIGDARRDYYWQAGKPVPDKILYPYPHPKTVGLVMDPEECATVKSVASGSVADAAGLRAGDEILAMNTQPLVSIADIQWVLHQTPNSGGAIDLTVRRDGQTMPMKLELDSKWKSADDRSWRVSSWGFGRITLGGMRVRPLDAQEKKQIGVPADQMALLVKTAGRYGAHGTARKVGFLPDDVILEYDGQSDISSESDLFHYVTDHCEIGQQVAVKILRGDRQLTLRLPIQE